MNNFSVGLFTLKQYTNAFYISVFVARKFHSDEAISFWTSIFRAKWVNAKLTLSSWRFNDHIAITLFNYFKQFTWHAIWISFFTFSMKPMAKSTYDTNFVEWSAKQNTWQKNANAPVFVVFFVVIVAFVVVVVIRPKETECYRDKFIIFIRFQSTSSNWLERALSMYVLRI